MKKTRDATTIRVRVTDQVDLSPMLGMGMDVNMDMGR